MSSYFKKFLHILKCRLYFTICKAYDVSRGGSVNRIREARKKKMMTMKDLGKLVGVAESTISMYETGKREPDNSTLKLLADILGVSIDYLLDRTNETETDDIKKAVAESANSPKQEISSLFDTLTPDEQEKVLSYARFVSSSKYTQEHPQSAHRSSDPANE